MSWSVATLLFIKHTQIDVAQPGTAVPHKKDCPRSNGGIVVLDCATQRYSYHWLSESSPQFSAHGPRPVGGWGHVWLYLCMPSRTVRSTGHHAPRFAC
jgi:hypothetical protein